MSSAHRGYAAYLVTNDSEIDLFRELAKGTRTSASLDNAGGVDVCGSTIIGAPVGVSDRTGAL